MRWTRAGTGAGRPCCSPASRGANGGRAGPSARASPTRTSTVMVAPDARRSSARSPTVVRMICSSGQVARITMAAGVSRSVAGARPTAARRPVRQGGRRTGRPPWWRRGRRTRPPTPRPAWSPGCGPASRVSTTLWATPGWVSSRPRAAAAPRQRGDPRHDLPGPADGPGTSRSARRWRRRCSDRRSGAGRSGSLRGGRRRPRSRPRASWWPSRARPTPGEQCSSSASGTSDEAQITTSAPARRAGAAQGDQVRGAGPGADEGDHRVPPLPPRPPRRLAADHGGRHDHRRQVGRRSGRGQLRQGSDALAGHADQLTGHRPLRGPRRRRPASAAISGSRRPPL